MPSWRPLAVTLSALSDAALSIRFASAGLTKLVAGVYHPYRRLFASERRHLPDVDVAAAAGWKDPATMRRSSQHADAAGVVRAVNNTA